MHFVDEQTDHGPIILQKAVDIGEKDTPASLEKKIHALEHIIYPEAIKLFLEKRLRIAGRKVKVLNTNYH